MSRLNAGFKTAAIVMMIMSVSAHATLMVYEPFAYTADTNLSGAGGAELGFATGSTWNTFTTGQSGSPTHFVQVHDQGQLTGVVNQNVPNQYQNPYTNTLTTLATAGNFVGRNDDSGVDADVNGFLDTKGADHMILWRELDSAVTATFVDGTTTWFSFVSARGFDLNARAPTFAIGQGVLTEDRGNNATDPVIGVGGFNNSGANFWAQYKDTAGAGVLTRDVSNNGNTWNGGTNNTATSDQMVNIIVAKIQWGATPADPDLVTFARFLDSETLDQATFDSKATTPFGAALDQSTFNQLSIAGGRFFVDELRIGTSFADVTPASGPAFDPADLDQDGDVDDADFGIAFAAFTGPNAGPSNNPAADLDNDGDVDDADFGIAFAAFTGPGGGAAVPEPTSLALLGLGGLMIARRRRA